MSKYLMPTLALAVMAVAVVLLILMCSVWLGSLTPTDLRHL